MNQKLSTIFSVFLLLTLFSCSSKKTLQITTEVKQEEEKGISTPLSNSLDDLTVNNLELDMQKIQLLINDNISEINRLKSEIEYLRTAQNSQALTPQEILSNPFDVYNKKIILNNGTTVFGNITYQDEIYVQVETLIGTLSLLKYNFIRVVDHKMIDLQQEKETLNVVKNSDNLKKEIPQNLNLAEVALLGEFQETLDENKNTILSGQVQNIGKKRADFIKVNFTIYKDRKYNQPPQEYTVFIEGSIQKFENNIVSNSSLGPNETGEFMLVVPNDFGPFISYSYNIDWEQYD